MTPPFPPPGHAEEPDESIPALASLEQDVSSAFVAVVKKKIHRRTAASQVASFSWNLPKVILYEFMGIFSHFFTSSHTSTKREDGSSER